MEKFYIDQFNGVIWTTGIFLNELTEYQDYINDGIYVIYDGNITLTPYKQIPFSVIR